MRKTLLKSPSKKLTLSEGLHLKIQDLAILSFYFVDRAKSLLSRSSTVEDIAALLAVYEMVPIQPNEFMTNLQSLKSQGENLIAGAQPLISKAVKKSLPKEDLEPLRDFLSKLSRLNLTFANSPALEAYAANYEHMGRLEEIAESHQKFTMAEVQAALTTCKDAGNSEVVKKVQSMLQRSDTWFTTTRDSFIEANNKDFKLPMKKVQTMYEEGKSLPLKLTDELESVNGELKVATEWDQAFD